MTGVQQRRHDITADGARGTQNIVSGSFSQHRRQSLSLSSNRERMAAPSSIVEHNLAATAKRQDMPALSSGAQPMLSGTPSSSYLCKYSARQRKFNAIFSFHFVSSGPPSSTSNSGRVWVSAPLWLAQRQFVAETQSPRANPLTHCPASAFSRT